MSLASTLWAAAESARLLRFNATAALERQMMRDGYSPASNEFPVEYGGAHYVGQLAGRPGVSGERVYFAERGKWDAVRFVPREVTGSEALLWPVGSPESERHGPGLPAGWTIPLGFGVAYALGIHPGIDISMPGESDLGAPVYAVADGNVTFAGDCHSSFGNVILIEHGAYAGFPFLASRYAHGRMVEVSVGQRVTQGQRIGTVGNGSVAGGQGPRFGAHLHFDLMIQRATACNWPSGPSHVVSDAARAAVARGYADPVGRLGV